MQAAAGDAARWGSTEYLLATVVDVVQVGNFLTHRAHFKGNISPPKPLSRPGDSLPEGRYGGRRTYTRGEMRKMLDNWGAGVVEILESKEVT